MIQRSKALEKKRIVHLAEGNFSLRYSKMTTGVLRYGYHDSVAVIDSTKAGKTAREVVGFGGDVPVVASLEEAMQFQPEAMLVGITPPGGRLPADMKVVLIDAINRGLDCYAGLHDFLQDDPDISAEAERNGVRLWDIRRPGRHLPIGAAHCAKMKSYITLAVGSDAAIGKMTVALEIQREAIRRGINAEFVATGQCGIAIAGWGSPIDAIAGDFMAGCVERDVLSCEGADIILVEGQGALLHPGFSSVTLALVHGACPDSFVLCHQCGRDTISRLDNGIKIPSLDKVLATYMKVAEDIKPAALACVSFNSSLVTEDEARRAIADAEDLLGVPATDPVRFGPGKLLDALEAHRKSIGK